MFFSALLHGCDERADSTESTIGLDFSSIAQAPLPVASSSLSKSGAPFRSDASDDLDRREPDRSELVGLDEVIDAITFDPPVLDFGRVLAGSVVSKEVWVINASELPVVVSGTHSSCGCTVAQLAGDRIPPGDAIRSVVRISLPKRPASVRKNVSFSIEGDAKAMILPVLVEAVRPVFADPSSIAESLLVGSVVHIQSLGGEAFRVLGAQPPVITSWSPEPDESHSIAIGEHLWIKYGRPRVVQILTDHPDTREVALEIRTPKLSGERLANSSETSVASVTTIRVEPAKLHLSTARLTFGVISEAHPGLAQLRIQCRDSSDTIPELAFVSSLASLELVGTVRIGNELILDIQLTPKRGVAGYVRNDLALKVSGARATCLVTAMIRSDKE